MSRLEGRLAAELRRLPGASDEVEERARRAALAALVPAPRRRLLRPLLAAVAAALLLLGLGAAALARIGALHLTAAPRRAAAPAVEQLRLPPGARAAMVVVGGRLWLTSRSGTRIERLPVTTAALSPHALYVAAGIGRSLVVMAPDGRRAWAVPTRGPVASIAWAPSGLRLAYVVRTTRGAELRTIEGDGDHDRLLDAGVRPVQPSWRADSLALAYVGRGGRGVVYDLAHAERRVVAPCARAVAQVAYAPSGDALALVGRTAAAVAAGGGARCSSVAAVAAAWVGSRLVLSVPARGDESAELTLFGGGGAVPVPGLGAWALAPAPHGLVALALARAGTVSIVTAEPPAGGAFRTGATLLRVRARGIDALAVR